MINVHLFNMDMKALHHIVPSMSMHILPMLLLVLVSLSIIPTGSASSSNQNYNAYNYDMTTPQFTPDGRLLQVEYASLAATHSSPCVIWKFKMGTDNNDQVTLIMTAKSSRKIQNRLIPLSNDDATATAVCCCLSGVISDSMALLSIVHQEQDNNRRMYGSALTDLQIANSIAMSCQRHSFGGGLRPYGSSIVIVSWNRILQTDPSGAAITVSCGATTTTNTTTSTTITTTAASPPPPLLHIVGGSGGRVEELQRTLNQAGSPETLDEALLVMAKPVLEASLGENHPPEDMWLEVMVVSKERGIHKLTDGQIERLLAKVRAQ